MMPGPFSPRELLQMSSAAAIGWSPFLSPTTSWAYLASQALNTGVPLESLTRQLEQALPELMRREDVPGLSIALIRDGGLVWSQGFGVKSRATREPVSAGTIFEAASL